MEESGMTDEERGTYEQLVTKSAKRRAAHRRRVTVISAVAFVFVGLLVALLRIWPGYPFPTRIAIVGLIYALYGGFQLAHGAVSQPSTLGLMSMTRYGGNSKLYEELMKSRDSAKAGIVFIMLGFACQLISVIRLAS